MTPQQHADRALPTEKRLPPATEPVVMEGQGLRFSVPAASILEEIYGHLCAVRSDLMTDRIDAEHVATARNLALVAWREQARAAR